MPDAGTRRGTGKRYSNILLIESGTETRIIAMYG